MLETICVARAVPSVFGQSFPEILKNHFIGDGKYACGRFPLRKRQNIDRLQSDRTFEFVGDSLASHIFVNKTKAKSRSTPEIRTGLNYPCCGWRGQGSNQPPTTTARSSFAHLPEKKIADESRH